MIKQMLVSAIIALGITLIIYGAVVYLALTLGMHK